MSWKKLLKENRVEKLVSSKDEIQDLRNLALRNIRDASLPDLSLDGKFSMAYNAARALSILTIRAEGYRIKASRGGHFNTFVAMQEAMGKEYTDLASYFDICRRKRNELNYDLSGVATGTEVSELIEKVNEFLDEVDAWLSKYHKEFMKAEK